MGGKDDKDKEGQEEGEAGTNERNANKVSVRASSRIDVLDGTIPNNNVPEKHDNQQGGGDRRRLPTRKSPERRVWRL